MMKHLKRFVAITISMVMAFQFCTNDFYLYAETEPADPGQTQVTNEPESEPSDSTGEAAEETLSSDTGTPEPSAPVEEQPAAPVEEQPAAPVEEQPEVASTLKVEFVDVSNASVKETVEQALAPKYVGESINLDELGINTNIEGYTLTEVKDKNDNTKVYTTETKDFVLTGNVTELQFVYTQNVQTDQPEDSQEPSTPQGGQEDQEDTDDDSTIPGGDRANIAKGTKKTSFIELAPGEEYKVTCTDSSWFHFHEWGSNKKEVAEVTTNKNWSGFQEGTQKIIAHSDGDAVIKCGDTVYNVHVETPALEGININGSNEVRIGSATKLSIEAIPKHASIEGAVWESSDKTKATVNEQGEVTGISEGTVTITATVGDISATKTITVTNPVSRISASPSSLKMLEGETATVSVTVTRFDGSTEENPQIQWSSDDPEVASVENGIVTAHSAGKTKLTATYEGHSAEVSVNVDNITYRLIYNSNYPADAKKFQYQNGGGTLVLEDAKQTNAVYEYEPNANAVIIEGMTCANYEFMGWSTDPNADNPDPEYATGTEIPMTANLTLYGVWGNRQEITTGTIQVVYQYPYKDDKVIDVTGAIINRDSQTATFVLANNQDTFASTDTSFYGWEIDNKVYSFNETVTAQYQRYGDNLRVYVDAAFDRSTEDIYAQFFVLKRNKQTVSVAGNYYSVGTGKLDSEITNHLVGTINDNAKYPAGADDTSQDVSEFILEYPDAERIASILNISLSETENIRWYVIKSQSDGYHVDGVIYDVDKYFNVYFHDGDQIIKTITVGDAENVSSEEFPKIDSEDFCIGN